MKNLFIVFSFALMISASAFAMPKWDGSYSCPKADGTVMQIDLATQVNPTNHTESLLVTGLSQNDAGLPCANASQTSTNDDASTLIAAACDDSSITYTFQLKQPSAKTDASLVMKISMVPPDKIAISVKASGTKEGVPTNLDQTLTCTKVAAAPAPAAPAPPDASAPQSN